MATKRHAAAPVLLRRMRRLTVRVCRTHLGLGRRKVKDGVHAGLGGHDDKRQGRFGNWIQTATAQSCTRGGIARCCALGASVAKVAMSHGIIASVVHRWRQLARRSRPLLATSSGELVPVSLPTMSPSTGMRDVQIQLRRGTATTTIA